jgi:UDP-arabinose 4-epimerase
MLNKGAKILVTGGAGYIGSHAAKALAERGFVPVTYDNLARGHRWAVQWGPLVEGDICDRQKLVRTIRTHEIAGALHFAAFAYVGESVAHPELYFNNNVAGSLTLFDALLETQVRNVILSSSCATYGTPDCAGQASGTPFYVPMCFPQDLPI